MTSHVYQNSINTPQETENRKILLLCGSVFALACLPFLILYASGEANVALGQGFQQVLGFHFNLFLLISIGIWSRIVGKEAPVLLPLTFVLIFAVASLMQLDHAAYPFSIWFVLGALLIYSVTLSLVNSRRFVVAVAVSSSIAFQLGTHNVAALEEMTDPLYFMLGQLLALVLVLSASVCFSIAAGDFFLNAARTFFPMDRGFMAALRSWFF